MARHVKRTTEQRCAGMAGRQNVICESNSVLKFIRPDIYITVLDSGTADFKASAREFLDFADALIMQERADRAAAWTNISLTEDRRRPVFRIRPPHYVTPEIVEFVRSRLGPTH